MRAATHVFPHFLQIGIQNGGAIEDHLDLVLDRDFLLIPFPDSFWWPRLAATMP